MSDQIDELSDNPLSLLATELIKMLRQREQMVASAESCTGGMIATAITDIAGSSAVFDRAFVTYSNEAKTEMLGVDATMIEEHGAVSSEVAGAMAEGALARSNADITVSVTGIAGPDGGSSEKPVGLVWFGCASPNAPTLVTNHVFDNHGRASIRHNAALFALQMVFETLKASESDEPLGSA